MARIAVLEFTQNSEAEPSHFVSRAMADKFLLYRDRGKMVVEQLRDGLLWIRANITFQKLKARVTLKEKCEYEGLRTDVEALRARGLILSYPLQRLESTRI